MTFSICPFERILKIVFGNFFTLSIDRFPAVKLNLIMRREDDFSHEEVLHGSHSSGLKPVVAHVLISLRRLILHEGFSVA